MFLLFLNQRPCFFLFFDCGESVLLPVKQDGNVTRRLRNQLWIHASVLTILLSHRSFQLFLRQSLGTTSTVIPKSHSSWVQVGIDWLHELVLLESAGDSSSDWHVMLIVGQSLITVIGLKSWWMLVTLLNWLRYACSGLCLNINWLPLLFIWGKVFWANLCLCLPV